MNTQSNPIIPRRSRRQQGIDETPNQVKTCSRKRTLASCGGARIAEVWDDQESEDTFDDESESKHDEDPENVLQSDHDEPIAEECEEDDEGINNQELSNGDRGNTEAEGSEERPDPDNKKDQEAGQEQEFDKDQGGNKKKKTRGPTRMNKVAKSHEEKVGVEFNSAGEPIGKGSVALSSFLGPLVREYVPVLLDDWRHIDEQTKETMWEEVQARFNLTEGWQKTSVFQQMGCIFRGSKSRLVRELRATKSKEKLRSLKPSNIHNASAWIQWVKRKTGQSFKVVFVKIFPLKYIVVLWE
ncbi:unnamed protein product [Microthlaspi erraticum]|uniref:Uncharacterized protein n=1 Tax=Microthlaspi erraticum TaxID=1685480 RepID=A0A6D2K1N9_9BRAS|nr:unnamed protein product [Microthlaspi erraticum]